MLIFLTHYVYGNIVYEFETLVPNMAFLESIGDGNLSLNKLLNDRSYASDTLTANSGIIEVISMFTVSARSPLE